DLALLSRFRRDLRAAGNPLGFRRVQRRQVQRRLDRDAAVIVAVSDRAHGVYTPGAEVAPIYLSVAPNEGRRSDETWCPSRSRPPFSGRIIPAATAGEPGRR